MLPKQNVTKEGVVVVIDDDASVREALKELFESVGLEVRLYASAGVFLEALFQTLRVAWCSMCGCPNEGIKVQEELSRADVPVPIVFVTAPWRHRDGRARNEGRCNRLPD